MGGGEGKQGGSRPGRDYKALLGKALRTIDSLEARLAAAGDGRPVPVAVLGAGCRLPGGVADPGGWWRLLREGREAIGEPGGRWTDADLAAAGAEAAACRRGGYLETVDGFDAGHFGMTPREARSTDPQHRLLLEVAWEALERSAIAPGSLRGSRTGVFVGINSNDYALRLAGDPASIDAYTGAANAASAAAGRLSYALGLRGPSLSVDTACSSSLTALHLACGSLAQGECELALVAGVNLILSPLGSVHLARAGVLAPDGVCRPFDAGARGIVRGEGCVVVVLRRLDAAAAERRPVRAVVRGTAINQDGASGGFTVPNPDAQEALVRSALERAGLEPGAVDYLEAHGTGTPLGDPIELRALGRVFADRHRPLPVGSVKANVGHLEAAAGLAGLLKVMVAMEHGELPPQLRFERPNPAVDWAATPLRVATAAEPWRRLPGSPACAGVSSFGMSGTNVHAVLTAPPELPAPASEEGVRHEAMALSARTPEALRQLAERHLHWLEEHPDARAVDVAATCALGRTPFRHRLAVVGSSAGELASALRRWLGGEPSGAVRSGVAPERPPRLAALFPGQGEGLRGVAAELERGDPEVRRALDRCEAIVDGLRGVSLRALLAGDEPERLQETRYSQPLLLALAYAQWRGWRAWGLRPEVVVGHSVGEYAAAVAAGVLPLEEALRRVLARGELLEVAAGAMVAVVAPPEEVEALLATVPQVEVAAYNGPRHHVVAGPREAVARLVEVAAARGLRTVEVNPRYAFHSAAVEPAVEPFAEALGERDLGNLDDGDFEPEAEGGRPVFLSTVTGGEVTRPDAEHWLRQLRRPVRFQQAVERAWELGCRAFVQAGPGADVLALARRSVAEPGEALWLPTLRPGQPDWRVVATTLATAWTGGMEVAWRRVFRGRHRLLELPTYPFQHQRLWLDPRPPAGSREAVDKTVGEEAGTPAGSAAEEGVEPRSFAVVWRSWQGPEPDAEPDAGPASRTVVVGIDDAESGILHGPTHGFELSSPMALSPLAPLSQPTLRALPGRGVGGEGILETRPRAWLADLAAADPADAAARLRAELGDGELRLWLAFGFDGADDAALDAVVEVLAEALEAVRTAVALREHGLRLKLGLVTRRGQAVEPGEAPSVAGAALWGFGRSVAQEHPEAWAGVVDVGDAADLATLGPGFVDGAGGEDQLALRGGVVRVPRLEPAAPAEGDGDPSFAADRVQLVTGGLGGVGRRVVRWMIGAGARKLVVVGRRPPEEVAKRLAELRSDGVSLTYLRADVSVREEVAAAVAAARRLGPLGAVVHLAGTAGHRPLLDLDAEALRHTCAAKVAGARWLDLETRGDDPAPFLLFSSVAATWGSSGQADYAAANAAVEAVAHRRRAAGRHATAVAWGPWAGGGMVTDDHARALTAIGLPPFEPVAGLRQLGGWLARERPAGVVAAVAWSTFLPVMELRRPAPFFADLAPRVSTAAPAAAAWRLDRPGELAERIRAEVAAVMGHPSPELVEPGRPLFDQGLDSLMAVELQTRLERGVGRPLGPTVVFDHPTVERLAGWLAERLAPDPEPRIEPSPASSPSPAPAVRRAADEPIAVVGIGCRFPGGVTDPEGFHAALMAGVDAVGKVPAERAMAAHLGDPGAGWGAFLDGYDAFDPAFFGLSEREARVMDPQHRLALEVAWEALERGGLSPAALRDTATGVFLGISNGDYGDLLRRGGAEADLHLATGNTASAAAGRISHLLGLSGPSLAVDTACSSALTAVHLACRSLLQGDCDLALAGGVHLILSPIGHLVGVRARMLAPDGRCKSFDAAADGYVRGEGCGVVVLARLSEARRRGLAVRALVRGSAARHDGTSGGLTVPSGPGQVAVLRSALAAVGVAPAEVEYVEAHGTGTPLGDPIELHALAEVYGGDREEPLRVGSVKTNVGHLEAAAGVAGLVKVLLALEHGELPGQLHLRRLNPRIDRSLPIAVAAESRPWPRRERPRRAGVSAFGFTGGNVHLVVEEAPPAPEVAAAGAELPLVLSARSVAALRRLARRFRDHLREHPELSPRDLCATALAGRSHFEHRVAVTGTSAGGTSAGELAEALGRFLDDRREPDPRPTLDDARRLLANAGGTIEGRRVIFPSGAVFPSGVTPVTGLAEALATLYQAGFDLDPALAGGFRRLALPTYPFERRSLLHPAARPGAAAAVGGEPGRARRFAVAWRARPRPGGGRTAPPSPPSAELAAAVRSHRELRERDPGWRRLGRRLEAVERDLGGVVVGILRRLGVGEQLGAGPTPAPALAERLGVVPERRRLFDRLLEIAAEDGWLAVGDGGVRRSGAPDSESDLGKVLGALGDTEAELLRAAVEAVPEVLRGGGGGLEALFGPGGDRADEVYASTAVSRHAHALLAAAADRVVRALPPGRCLRVLEVGAGTGGATRALLDLLPPERTDYLFTDLSAGFLPRARERFAGRGFVRFGTFDLERDPGEQGLGGFDLVVAANVVHATHNLEASMRHLRRALAPGGRLLLLEGVAPRRRIDLVFGLTDGWWRFEDHQLRPRHPLLGVDGWRRLAAAVGLEDFAAVTGSASESGAAAESAVLTMTAPAVEVSAEDAASEDATLEDATLEDATLEDAGAWLLVGGPDGLARRLAGRLEAAGGSCRRLASGALEELRRAVASPGGSRRETLRGVVHLGSLDASELDPEEELPDAVARITDLLPAVQALVTAPAPPPLWLVTAGAAGPGAVAPRGRVQAMTWGLGRTLAREHPESWGGLVDLPPSPDPEAEAQLVRCLLDPDGEDQVVVRGVERWLPRLEPLAEEAPEVPATATATATAMVRGHGSYWITGGLGGLGRAVAGWLVERGARSLVLTGRRADPGAEDPDLERWRAAGVTVTVLASDVSSRAAVEEVVATVEAGLPPLRGVVHAAGTLADGLLARQHRERFAEVFGAKVYGTAHLLRALRGRGVDWLVLFGSAVSVLGSPGQANHAAANAYLDAAADAGGEGEPRVLTVAWGPWAEVGAAARRGAPRSAARPMAPGEALSALERCLAGRLAGHLAGRRNRVLVAELDPEATDELPILAELVGEGDAAGAGARRAVLEAVESGLPTVARLRLRELTVARLEQVLGAAGVEDPELRHDLPLVELGLDSLMVLELRNRLARDLDLTLPASLFYDHPTLDAVVAFLARELGVGEAEADAGAPRTPSTATDLLAEVEGLSLDETEAELERLAGADPTSSEPSRLN